MAAILKFWQPLINTRLGDVIIALIEYLDPENMGIDTRIMLLRGSETEI